MESLACLLMLPTYIQLKAWNFETPGTELIVMMYSTQASPTCPICKTPTSRTHSQYERTIRDLPLSNYGVCWKLSVRKCFCSNNNCPRRIFTERLAEAVQPWARKTMRFIERLNSIGLALAGSAGARLSLELNLQTSRETLLRLIRRIELPQITTPRVLGVDDWALHKGHRYGTILVNLETGQPIALLPDREPSTLSDWLKNHPGVEIISRDRSLAYKKGASEGAPDAIQVADRFHILENLADALEKTFKDNVRELKEVETLVSKQSQVILSQSIDLAAVPPPVPEKKDLLHAQQCRQQRLEHYQHTWALHDQGLTFEQIAQQVGISTRTVSRYHKQPTFYERQHRKDRGRGVLDPYKPHLLERWNQGCRDGRQLYEELKTLGYPHSYNVVAAYLRCLRQIQVPEQSPPLQCVESPYFPLTARRATWLVLGRGEQTDEESEVLLSHLKRYCSIFTEAITLAQDFTHMLRKQEANNFDDWLKRAVESPLAALSGFARGLMDDYEAVKAGLTLNWSNGPVEGQINRLKMLKRQMYGRAGLDLLSKRFILLS